MWKDSAGLNGSDVVVVDTPRRFLWLFHRIRPRSRGNSVFRSRPRMAGSPPRLMMYNTVDKVSSFAAHGNNKRPSGIVPGGFVSIIKRTDVYAGGKRLVARPSTTRWCKQYFVRRIPLSRESRLATLGKQRFVKYNNLSPRTENNALQLLFMSSENRCTIKRILLASYLLHLARYCIKASYLPYILFNSTRDNFSRER